MLQADPVEYAERGFTVARGFFSREETDVLLGEIERQRDVEKRPDHLSAGALIFTSQVFMRSEKVQRFLAQQRLIDYIRPVTGDDLWVRWDQAVTKAPGAGVFCWHQDNWYNRLLTEHFQVWVALTDSRNQNGAIWLAPGSHKRGLLPHKGAPSNQVEVIGDVGETVCVDAQVGDLILFSSLMLHRTGPNSTEASTRVAYVAEYMPQKDVDYYLRDQRYFIAATNGRSDAHFVEQQPGKMSAALYRRYRTREIVEDVKRPLRRMRNRLLARPTP